MHSGAHHHHCCQGLLLDCGPLEWGTMEKFEDAPEATDDGSVPPLWLALDEVYDPVSCYGHHNMETS